MVTKKLPTQFAPAERAPLKTITRQKGLLEKVPFLNKLYDAVSDIVLILNKERQIVFFNRNLLDFLDIQKPAEIYGLRVGEALRCVHAHAFSGGCGTSKFCSLCGAAKAILNSQKGNPNTQECRITREYSNDALELLVNATPWKHGRESYTIFSLKDISHEKRRKALEKIFFHDVMNTAACLQMASELLPVQNGQDISELRTSLLESVDKLIDDINSQKMLIAAEQHELKAKPAAVDVQSLMEKLISQFLPMSKKKKVRLFLHPTKKIEIKTDESILLRVLGNMVKNAIEASRPKEKVTVSVTAADGLVSFSVNNPAAMPPQVQLQIFHRSFSTKGPGRGLGTYSMKLLCEGYLKGSIIFTSNKKSGTTFTASLPIH